MRGAMSHLRSFEDECGGGGEPLPRARNREWTRPRMGRRHAPTDLGGSMTLPRLLAAPILALAAAVPAGAAQPEIVYLKAARLIDGRAGAVRAPAIVRVEGERIAEVGERLVIPPGARVVDLGDATLLPGLIDLHTHLTDRFGVHWEEALVTTTPGQAALWGAKNARDTLMAGFTTCRDMGP